MATSEYCSCPPRLPTPTASHVAIASGVNHRVTSPRWTSARSYAGQFPTRYFVLYLGCTLDFTSRSCPFGRHDGQGRDEHLFPRTNATLLGPFVLLLLGPPHHLRHEPRRVQHRLRRHRLALAADGGRRRLGDSPEHRLHRLPAVGSPDASLHGADVRCRCAALGPGKLIGR